MLLAQLTDTHVVGSANEVDLYVDNNKRLAQAVDRLNAETVQPDAVLVTGDVTENGTSDEVQLAATELARLRAPMFLVPGNHDRRDTLRAGFAMPWSVTDDDDGHLSWVVDLGSIGNPVRVVGLDTIVPGEHGGEFDAERQQWLVEVLAEHPGRPTVIAMHHPPFATGIQWMDDLGFEGADQFGQVVASYGNIQRIFCGHIHRSITTTIGGTTTSIGPSTAHHVELNIDPTAPIQIVRDPAGYQLHHFDGIKWVSHNRYFDTGEEPFTPTWS